SHTPCNRCVRFAANVAVDHATLATKRTLLLTWAGLPPAGSHQLCLAHSFDHLVGALQERLRDREAKRLGGGQVDYEIELGWLLERLRTIELSASNLTPYWALLRPLITGIIACRFDNF